MRLLNETQKGMVKLVIMFFVCLFAFWCVHVRVGVLPAFVYLVLLLEERYRIGKKTFMKITDLHKTYTV